MGLFDQDEHTLYKPAGAGAPPAGAPAPAAATGQFRQMPPQMAAMEDDEDRASLVEVIKFAFRSAGRRKLLSFSLLLVGAGITAAAVRYAPRTYQSTGEVLVVSPVEETTGWGTENRRQQMEWERQVRSRDAIEGVVRDAQLVEKWDEARQPHRILFDQINAKMGERPPTAEQKFGAAVGMVENMLKLTVDQNTVSISCDWSTPEAAHDIVQAALSRFIDKRYQTEVGSFLTRIQPLEAQLEDSRKVLEAIDPSLAPPKAESTQATPVDKLIGRTEVSAEAAEASRKLPAARDRQAAAAAKLAEFDNGNRQKLARLQNELQDKSAFLGPAHPDIVTLKRQIADAQKEPPEAIAARSAKERADAEVADLAAKAGVAVPRMSRAATATPTKKVDELTLQRIAAARDEYNRKKDALDTENLKLRVAEAAFKSKYQITQPPDVPMRPKKPMGALVGLGGAFATLLVLLALASLRDRSAGIFFEAKHVRDRLRLPVLGDIQEADISG